MLSKFIASSAAMVALSSLVTAAPQLSIPAQLQLADSVADRYQILPNNEDFVFDFNTATVPIASRKNFHALVGTGLSVTVGRAEGCSMAALHIHPRSAEIFVVLEGRMYTEMIPEGGVVDADGKPRVIRTELRANQTTIFPQGSFHAQVNPDCTPALAVAAFASDDPGAALVVPQVFTQTDDFVLSSFGDAISPEELARFREAIPKGAILEAAECRKRCGL
ncbi:hypothetical protein MFIFM68171_01694 [Madurella fahalii]|uniref:Cupin type-1 domain-containing protein n=1 Tax=Madurella fahalii TaxID=1157608 RepID=A0ABQ0G168_9PEZI